MCWSEDSGRSPLGWTLRSAVSETDLNEPIERAPFVQPNRALIAELSFGRLS